MESQRQGFIVDGRKTECKVPEQWKNNIQNHSLYQDKNETPGIGLEPYSLGILDCQSKGEEPNVKEVATQELDVTMVLTTQDDEDSSQVFEQISGTAENENLNPVAELELYIHQCHQRIGEFNQELKQRDSVISQLRHTLNGILNVVKKGHEEGQSAEDYMEVLKTRVRSATEYFSSIYQVKDEDDDIILEEQDRSLTEISESPAVHPVSLRSNEIGVSEGSYEQCSNHCNHLKEINEIKEKVMNSLEFLQVPSDVLIKQRDLGLASNIEQLLSQTCMHKHASKDALAQLQSTQEESKVIKSEVINKKEEINKLNAQIEELNVELKTMKDRCNKLEQDSTGRSSFFVEPDEDQKRSGLEGRCMQSYMDMNIMKKLLENFPCDLSELSDIKDKLSNSNLIRTEEEQSFMVLANMNSASSNEAMVPIECTKGDLLEHFISDTSSILQGCENGMVSLENNQQTDSSKMAKNGSAEVKVNLEIPIACDATSDIEGRKVVEKFSSDKPYEIGFGAFLLGKSNIEEHLLDLGAKARDLAVMKKQLKVMEEREESLKNQLSSAMEACDKAEKRCKNAENLAMNLQTDLDNLLCKKRASEVNKSGLLAAVTANVDKEISIMKSASHEQVKDENEGVNSLKDNAGSSMEIGEDFIPNFLSTFWDKMQLLFDIIVNIYEEKTDLLFPKKIAPLKASIESDMYQLALYLKRKNDTLTEAKMSLEVESYFQELKIRVAESLSPCNLRSLSAPEGNEDATHGLNRSGIINCSPEDILSSVNSVHLEMDSINAKVIQCLRYCMEQEYDKRTTELRTNHANDVASLKQHHAIQLINLKQEFFEKLAESQGRTEEMIMAKPSMCWEMEPADIEIKDCHKKELEAVWIEVDEKHREALKQIFKRIAAEQISLATKIYKENYDLKVNQEINLLKSVHKQAMESMKATLEHQKLMEELSIRQEVSKSSKDSVNELIRVVESDLKGLQSRCYDMALKASQANVSTLDELRKKIIEEFQMALKDLSEAWLNKLEKQVKNEEEDSLEGYPMSNERKSSELCSEIMNREDQPHPQNPFVNIRAMLIFKSEGHIKEMAHWQLECLKELMEKLLSEQAQLKMKLLEIYCSRASDILPTEDNGKLTENRSESYSMNQNIRSLMGAGCEAWINNIKILKELEAKHAKDMESLRLYFEKKYAEVEKRYSEDVLTQRSKKCSHTGSSDGSSNTSIAGSEAELESDHFFLNPEDADPSRNLEEYERVSMDMQLMVGQEMSLDERRIEFEAKIREELRLQFAEENEKRLTEIIKELELKHEEKLKEQIAAEAQAYSDHIEEVTNAIKKCSEEEQEKFIRSHREMMDKFLEQHQKDLIDLNELHDRELHSLQQRDMSEEVEELKAEIEKMHRKYNQELLLASQRLIQDHAKEVSELKENLKRQYKEEIDRLKEEIKRKEEYCEEVKRHGEAKLEEFRENIDSQLQEKVEQARHTIIKNLDGQIQALLVGKGGGKDVVPSIELSRLKEHLALEDSQLAEMKDQRQGEAGADDHLTEDKALMSDPSELSNPVLLEQRVDLLKHGIESDFNDRFSRSECMGRDLVTLKLQVNQLEQSKNILLSRFGETDMEIDDATSVTVLHTDLDKLLKDRDKWKKVSQAWKTLLKDILEYTHNCEDELNDTIVQSLLRLSGVSENYSLLEESANGVDHPRRVHIAPERLPNILVADEIEDGEQGEDVISWLEGSGEEIRVELRHCLARLRAEASALLGLSTTFKHSDDNMAFNNNIHSQQDLLDKISLLENHLKMETAEKDRLKVELHTTKGLCEGHASNNASLLARVDQAEAQLTSLLMKKAEAQRRLETVAEGFGEASDMSHFNGQLQKIAKLGEKARMVLKEYQHQGGAAQGGQAGLSGTLIAQLVEELCVEGDRLSDEARKEREDLQLQVEAADKQLRSTRAFLEEQAVEREQEREEFQRELHRLHEALEGREREKVDRERIAKEEIPKLNQKEGQDTDPSSRATVESLEQHSKDLSQSLQETATKKEELEVELKAAVDKIWDLREIIRELEGQVEGSLLLEKDLRAKNERLAAEMALQGKKLNDLIEELESLRSSLGYSIPGEMENEGHTALLEKALRKHCLQVEQAKALGPSLKNLTYKLLDMGQLIDKKTKEIEALQVTPATCGNCSSPSEDVSIREQLEQATWRSESPLEDEVSELGVQIGDEDENCPSKSSSSHPIPRVPISELTSLQEKFSRHCQAQEPLLKRIHDLEMQLHSLRRNEEELTTEREVLQSQVEQQLLHTSELQARLDEARRRVGRQVHCMTVTPLPSSPLIRSPIGSPSTTPEQPFFCCAALADARHEIENVTECLEKKELEVTQLKGALENSKKVVASQEKELTIKAHEEAQTLEKLKEFERLKSEKDALQIKLSHRIKTDGGKVPFAMLLDALLAEKNEEIDFLSLQLTNLKEQLLKANEDSKVLSLKVVQLSKVPADDNEPTPQHASSDFSFGDEIEVLRDCVAPEVSIERVDMIHSEDHHKKWFHSTKLGVHTSADSPGLTESPLMPYIRESHDLVNKPLLEEESPKMSACYPLSSTGNSNSMDAAVRTGEEQAGGTQEDTSSASMQDAEVQTSSQTEIDDLKVVLGDKEEKIKTLSIKVDELLVEKNDLSSLIVELREKISWHSQHLEKLEEESLGRDSVINDMKAEKDSLQMALLKSEQEMSALKMSHSAVQEEMARQEEQIKLLNGKIEKYSRVNKEQHMLLKAAQQERKEVLFVIDSSSIENQHADEHYATSPSNSSEKQNSSNGRDSDTSQRKLLSPVSVKNSLREAVIKLVEEVKYLRSELNNIASQRDNINKELTKALEVQESLRAKINAGPSSEALEPFSGDERGASPLERGTLEQMMEKVQQEGIEVLSLSEIAASRKSTSGDGTPVFISTPLGSPLFMEEKLSDHENSGSLTKSQKNKQEMLHEEERMRLLQRIQALQDELSAKEREETRKRDWLEFQEKEGHAGWTGVVEAVGQKQRHELNILERLGEQRNARVRLEAEVAQLKQQLSQAEAEARKAVYRLGMERSHVIRLESALQQEKSNFSQLQVSLDTERKRSNMTKELNARVNKALQGELAQYQARFAQLQVSLKQEHDMRRELETQLSQMQIELGYAAGASEEQRMRLEVMMSDEHLKLKKIEEDCERKALEQELEEEKHKRMEYQQELIQLRKLLEARPNQDYNMAVESSRWSSATSPSAPHVGESSFNAEDMLQNLKGINQVLGWHVRNKDDYQNPNLSSLETEKNFLEAKCCHLEQKLVALQDVLTREQSLWANERASLLRDQQYLYEVNEAIPHHSTSKEIHKFQEVIRKLYAYYWRSERNRKALAWQKRYFLSLLENYKAFKHQTISELSKVSDEQRCAIDKVSGRSKVPSGASIDAQMSRHKLRGNKSFRVVVWSVIATLKMKVLVLRSMTGIRIGSQSLLEEIIQPVHPQSNMHHSPYNQQTHLTLPYSPGASDGGSQYNVHSLSPAVTFRKNYSIGEMKYQHFP